MTTAINFKLGMCVPNFLYPSRVTSHTLTSDNNSIGCGTMGLAILTGLIDTATVQPEQVVCTTSSAGKHASDIQKKII